MHTWARMGLFLCSFLLLGWFATAQANNGLNHHSQVFVKNSYALQGQQKRGYHRYDVNPNYARYHRYKHYRGRYYPYADYYKQGYTYRHYPYRQYPFRHYAHPKKHPHYGKGTVVRMRVPDSQFHWKNANYGRAPYGAIRQGYHEGRGVYSCRVTYGGTTHYGKLIEGKGCYYNPYGVTRRSSYYQVLSY